MGNNYKNDNTVYPSYFRMLSVSLEFPFLIAPSVLSNVYSQLSLHLQFKTMCSILRFATSITITRLMKSHSLITYYHTLYNYYLPDAKSVTI